MFHVKPKAPPVPPPPIAAICKCPNCGHGVMQLFIATPERLEAIENRGLGGGNTGRQFSGAKADKVVHDQVVKERAERSVGPRVTKIYDPDQRSQPKT